MSFFGFGVHLLYLLHVVRCGLFGLDGIGFNVVLLFVTCYVCCFADGSCLGWFYLTVCLFSLILLLCLFVLLIINLC